MSEAWRGVALHETIPWVPEWPCFLESWRLVDLGTFWLRPDSRLSISFLCVMSRVGGVDQASNDRKLCSYLPIDDIEKSTVTREVYIS